MSIKPVAQIPTLMEPQLLNRLEYTLPIRFIFPICIFNILIAFELNKKFLINKS